MRGLRDLHSELDIDMHVEYLIDYFKDMNRSSREVSDGETITKTLIIAYKLRDELKSSLTKTDQRRALLMEI